MERTLANVVIVGAQKAGTTALYRYLGAHPEVFPCAPKEPHFFSERHNWHRGVGWYASLFEAGSDHRIRVEASTTCTMFPHIGAAERMASVIPDARLIYVLRDPIMRMRSGYLHALTAGSERRPIEEALLDDARYANISRYALQIDELLRYFPREQLLVLRYEDLAARAAETLDQVLSFLGLDAGWRPDDLGTRYNRSSVRRVPRAYWRALGGVVHRVTWTQPIAARLFGDVDRSSPAVSRPVRPQERVLDPVLIRRLRALVRCDLLQLRDRLGPGWDWGHLEAT